MSLEQAVILCGGKGTRLGSLTQDIPKPLISVGGVAMLDRTIELLATHGIKRVILLAGHLGELIEKHYSEGQYAGIEVETYIEPEPLGTAGGLHFVADRLEGNFLLFYGDIFVHFDVSALVKAHMKEAETPLATLLVRQSDHPWDSHLVDIDDDCKVVEFIAEQEEGKLYKNWGNAALYVFHKNILDYIPRDKASDYGKDVFPAALSQSAALKAHPLEPSGFVRDMGTPERLALVENYLKREARSLKARENPKPLKVAFLDRDGTLNFEKGLISCSEQIEMIPGAAEGVAKLCEAGWRCFIITNQPVIARGLCDERILGEINEKVVSEIESQGGQIEKIYYSPYHPETHHGDGVKSLRRASDCRKPGSGMLYQAEEENEIDLAEVVMIGDTFRDIIAGKGAGVRTCYLGTEKEAGALEADFCFTSLSNFVDYILLAE